MSGKKKDVKHANYLLLFTRSYLEADHEVE
jgi:hypothetical protein